MVIVDLAIALLCILPLLLTTHIPYEDLPNHLARQFVIAGIQSNASLQRYYTIHWQLVPNLAVDLFTLVVGRILPIELSVRLFCISTILLIFIGVRAISRSVGDGTSKIYRCVPILAYGGPVQFGFLNYSFGIGVALLVFALYLRARMWSTPRLLAFFAPLGFLLLLCHIAAFFMLAAAIIGAELAFSFDPTREDRVPSDQAPSDQVSDDSISGVRVLGNQTTSASSGRPAQDRPHTIRWRVLLLAELRATGFLLPPLLLFIVLGPSSASNAAIDFGNLHDKLDGVVAITLYSMPWPELGVLATGSAVLAIAVAARFVRWTRPGLGAVGLQTVIWLLAPKHAMGGGYVDYRLPWAIALFALATLTRSPTPAPLGPATLTSKPQSARSLLQNVLTTICAILAVVRITSLSILWLATEPALASIDQAMSRVPEGTRLLSVIGPNPSTSAGRRPPLTNIGAYAVIRRQAYWPDLFAGISGQILSFTPAYAHDWTPVPNALLDIPESFDHVLVLAPEYSEISPSLPLRCLRQGPKFRLYEISRHNAVKPYSPCP